MKLDRAYLQKVFETSSDQLVFALENEQKLHRFGDFDQYVLSLITAMRMNDAGMLFDENVLQDCEYD